MTDDLHRPYAALRCLDRIPWHPCWVAAMAGGMLARLLRMFFLTASASYEKSDSCTAICAGFRLLQTSLSRDLLALTIAFLDAWQYISFCTDGLCLFD